MTWSCSRGSVAEQQTRAALEDSRRMLRTAARIAHLTYWDEDFASNRITIPDEGYRVLGLPPSPNSQARTFDEIIEFIHPEDRILLQESRRRAIEGTPSKLTVRLVLADGEVRHIEIAAEAIRDEAGSPVRVVGAIQDISTRMQAARALHESQERLELALLATGLGPWEWDLRTNETKFWPAWKRQIGYEPDELPNRYEEWESRLHPEDRERVLTDLHDYLDGHGSKYDPEFRLRHKDGTYRWIATRGAILRDASGTPTHMLGCHLDITDRKRLEEKFLHAQRMEAIGQLAGGVAHDFNNILTVILVESDFLLSLLPETDPNRDMVIAIRQASERAAALTGQLLTFARRAVLGPKVLDLNEVIRDNERMLRRLIGEDLGLATMLDPSAEPVRIDPGQAAQVIMNLAVNARDAMPTGGKLTIETSRVALDETAAGFITEAKPGRYVVLAVSDTGVGMTREVMAHIFEPFFTTKGPQQGTGLGLATVYGIVKQSGGFSDVYSEPGHGTTFKLYFPVAEGRVEKSRLRRETTPSGGDETILLVEDDQEIRTLLRGLLERARYTVLDAHQGSDALRLAAGHAGPIHLLLTDVVMPGMGGRELLECLASLRPRLRVLYMSGYTDDAMLRHGVQQSEVAFLQKPFTVAALMSKVREVLDE